MGFERYTNYSLSRIKYRFFRIKSYLLSYLLPFRKLALLSIYFHNLLEQVKLNKHS